MSLDELKAERQKLIDGEVERMKRNPGGKGTSNTLIYDSYDENGRPNGNVIGRTSESNNPDWYQKAYKKLGRKPNKSEYPDIALDNLREHQEFDELEQEIARREAQQPETKKAAESGGELSPKDRVLQTLRGIVGQDITNKATGIVAKLGTKGAKKMLSNKAVNKSLDNGFTMQQHLEAAENIKQLYEDAELSEESQDRNNDPNIASVRRFHADTTVGGEPATAKITVKESISHGHRIYSVELEALEKPVEYGTRADNASSTGSKSSPQKDQQAGAIGADEHLSSISSISQEQENVERENSRSQQEKTAEGEYKYYMNARPVSPGAQPKGFTRFDEEDEGGRHGAIYYDHPLTEQEIADYELTPAERSEKKDSQEAATQKDYDFGDLEENAADLAAALGISPIEQQEKAESKAKLRFALLSGHWCVCQWPLCEASVASLNH